MARVTSLAGLFMLALTFVSGKSFSGPSSKEDGVILHVGKVYKGGNDASVYGTGRSNRRNGNNMEILGATPYANSRGKGSQVLTARSASGGHGSHGQEKDTSSRDSVLYTSYRSGRNDNNLKDLSATPYGTFGGNSRRKICRRLIARSASGVYDSLLKPVEQVVLRSSSNDHHITAKSASGSKSRLTEKLARCLQDEKKTDNRASSRRRKYPYGAARKFVGNSWDTFDKSGKSSVINKFLPILARNAKN